MNKKKKKRIIQLIVGLATMFVIFLILGLFHYYELENNKRYTIGITTGMGWSGGSELNYEYNVNNKTYKAGTPANNNYRSLIRKRFFVKFSSRLPEIAKILLNMPVPDSIKEAPVMGWDSIEFKKLFGEEK